MDYHTPVQKEVAAADRHFVVGPADFGFSGLLVVTLNGELKRTTVMSAGYYGGLTTIQLNDDQRRDLVLFLSSDGTSM